MTALSDRRFLLSGARDFAHQHKRVVVGVAEEGHPQIVSLKRRNERGLLFKVYAARQEDLIRALDIRNSIVDEGTRMVELRFFRRGKHEPYAVAIKESHVTPRLEQELHPKRVAIERDRL